MISVFPETMAVDIGSRTIKILVGDKKRVRACGILNTPEESVLDGRIINMDKVCDSIQGFIKANNIKTKNISFVVHGQDIVIRHVDVPIMNEEGVRNAVEWEMKQYLPENGERHYIDFQIQAKIVDENSKVFKVMVVAVPRNKIDSYAELAGRLKLKLRAIDISSNCASRVFSVKDGKNKDVKCIGIIDIGYSSTSIAIIEEGKLFIEREVSFGLGNIIKEVSRKLQTDEAGANKYISSEFNFNSLSEGNEVERRVLTLFDNVLSTLLKVIQFYFTGKTKKNLDEIYLIGGGCRIRGIDTYVENYMNSPTYILDSLDKISDRIKLPGECDLSLYFSALGLLLRKE